MSRWEDFSRRLAESAPVEIGLDPPIGVPPQAVAGLGAAGETAEQAAWRGRVPASGDLILGARFAEMAASAEPGRPPGSL